VPRPIFIPLHRTLKSATVSVVFTQSTTSICTIPVDIAGLEERRYPTTASRLDIVAAAEEHITEKERHDREE
jgi:hypothetical protein